jgi:hypothetical protein
MFCPACRAKNPADANFCTQCAAALRPQATCSETCAQPGAEYQELTIPLSVEDWTESDQRNWAKIEPTIHQQLEPLEQEGWEPATELDLHALRHAAAFSMRSDLYGHATYEAVKIPLKRSRSDHDHEEPQSPRPQSADMPRQERNEAPRRSTRERRPGPGPSPRRRPQ